MGNFVIFTVAFFIRHISVTAHVLFLVLRLRKKEVFVGWKKEANEILNYKSFNAVTYFRSESCNNKTTTECQWVFFGLINPKASKRVLYHEKGSYIICTELLLRMR